MPVCVGVDVPAASSMPSMARIVVSSACLQTQEAMRGWRFARRVTNCPDGISALKKLRSSCANGLVRREIQCRDKKKFSAGSTRRYACATLPANRNGLFEVEQPKQDGVEKQLVFPLFLRDARTKDSGRACSSDGMAVRGCGCWPMVPAAGRGKMIAKQLTH